jgi:hypothetical protein
MNEITIRRLSDGDIKLLPELMEHCFGMKVNESYFKWKFIDNPAGKFIGFGAFHHHKLIAYYGVIPEKYLLENKEVIIYQSGDTMTHADFRRKGLFEQLATTCFNEIRKQNDLVVIGFGGEKSTPGLVKMGWVHLADFKYYFKHALQCRLSLWFGVSVAYQVSLVHRYDNILQYREQMHQTELIRPVISNDFLAWRLSNPRFSYSKYVCYKNQTPCGYIIFYEDSGKIFILDFEAENQAAQNALLREAYKYCLSKGLMGVITIAIPQSDMAKRLMHSGFIRNITGRGPLTTIIPFLVLADRRTDLLSKIANWSINPICHDAL